jgi:hypothetical protein
LWPGRLQRLLMSETLGGRCSSSTHHNRANVWSFIVRFGTT